MALVELLGASVAGKKGTVDVATIAAEKDVVGIYFSAHWCPPCRMFTPALAKVYNKITEDGKGFEIVFVSSDKDQDAFDEYYGEMPWLSLPFVERDLKAKLSEKYGVRGIPTLILVDAKTGNTITADGRGTVTSDPEGAKFPWTG